MVRDFAGRVTTNWGRLRQGTFKAESPRESGAQTKGSRSAKRSVRFGRGRGFARGEGAQINKLASEASSENQS
jgi:hypothetical protein